MKLLVPVLCLCPLLACCSNDNDDDSAEIDRQPSSEEELVVPGDPLSIVTPCIHHVYTDEGNTVVKINLDCWMQENVYLVANTKESDAKVLMDIWNHILLPESFYMAFLLSFEQDETLPVTIDWIIPSRWGEDTDVLVVGAYISRETLLTDKVLEKPFYHNPEYTGWAMYYGYFFYADFSVYSEHCEKRLPAWRKIAPKEGLDELIKAIEEKEGI